MCSHTNHGRSFDLKRVWRAQKRAYTHSCNHSTAPSENFDILLTSSLPSSSSPSLLTLSTYVCALSRSLFQHVYIIHTNPFNAFFLLLPLLLLLLLLWFRVCVHTTLACTVVVLFLSIWSLVRDCFHCGCCSVLHQAKKNGREIKNLSISNEE